MLGPVRNRGTTQLPRSWSPGREQRRRWSNGRLKSQVPLEEAGDASPEPGGILTHGEEGHVRLAGVQREAEVFARPQQRLYELHRVLKVHVVVAGAVEQHE